MRAGPWHQFGHNSQRLALEQLKLGVGVGVILSSRDLTQQKAAEYAPQYVELGADVLWDPQFYVPEAGHGKLNKWDIAGCRQRVSTLQDITTAESNQLKLMIESSNQNFGCSAILAPAVLLEAGRNDIVDLNLKLFELAKAAGDSLGIPTYASVPLGRSTTSSDVTLQRSLTDATATLSSADGWYFAFEFDSKERICADTTSLYRMMRAGLQLSLTGMPVMHAFGGPTGLLSRGWGATAVGVGHSQNLWQMDPTRFEPPPPGTNGGQGAARHFSRKLWGTLIDPDEVIQLPPPLRSAVYTDSPFSGPHSRHETGKHLVHVISGRLSEILDIDDAQEAMTAAVDDLDAGWLLYQQVREVVGDLKDHADSYHQPWKAACLRILKENADDYDFLKML